MELADVIVWSLVGLVGVVVIGAAVYSIVTRIRSGTDHVTPESMNERIQAQKQVPAGYARPRGPGGAL